MMSTTTTQLFILIVIGTFLLILQESHSKVTRFYFEKSSLNKNWYFIDTFAFDNAGSKSMGEVFWRFNNKDVTMLKDLTVNLYMDTKWEELQQAMRKSKYNMPCSQVVSQNFTSYSVELQKHPSFTIKINQSTRPRFWYVILGACSRDGSEFKSKSRQFIELDFQWQNPGGYFRKQFSKDRQGIMAVLLVFTPVLTGLSLAYIFSVFMLYRSRCFHWIIRVFFGSLVLYTISCWLSLLHNLKYGKDGFGIPFFDVLGTGLRLCAELSFLILMYLIASGWTVTQPYLRHMKQIIAISITFIVLYITMFAWSQISLAVQITTSDYVYETIPGILIGILRIPALGFFLYALRTTYKKEVSVTKIWFYRFFGIIYTLWFIFLPILIVTQFLISKWNRPKWIEGISRSVELVSYTIMFFMLWYSRARKYFAISEDEQQKGMFEEL